MYCIPDHIRQEAGGSLQGSHGLQHISDHKCKGCKPADDEDVTKHPVVDLAVQSSVLILQNLTQVSVFVSLPTALFTTRMSITW